MSTLAFDLKRWTTRETAPAHGIFDRLIANRQRQANDRITSYLARFSDDELDRTGLDPRQMNAVWLKRSSLSRSNR